MIGLERVGACPGSGAMKPDLFLSVLFDVMC